MHLHQLRPENLRKTIDFARMHVATETAHKTINGACTELDRLMIIELKARAFMQAQSAYRGKTGVLGFGTEIEPAAFESLFDALEGK